MVNVAIAGGTGGVGRTIADALRNEPAHKTIILSRGAQPTDSIELGLTVIEVDYDDIESLRAMLEQHEINTVISALAMHVIGVGESQLNLIKAADSSGPTKRFVTSTRAVRPSTEYLSQLPHGFQHIDAYAQLAETELEWTAFNLGWFLEYYGMPHIDTYIPQTTFVVDMANNRAAIPGDGEQAMTFTYTKDVAKYVVAALDLPKWERDTYIIGDKMTWNEFVKLAQDAKGKEFTVVYDSIEKLRSGEIAELPGQVAAYSYFAKEWTQKLFSVFGFWVTQGVFDFPDQKALNHRFPEIKATSVKDMLDKAWKTRTSDGM